MKRLPWRLALVVAAAAVATICHAIQTAVSASSTCSATAKAAWRAQCEARTEPNRAFIPLTNMDRSEINLDGYALIDSYNEARRKAQRVSGAVGNAAMSGLRKKNHQWYEDSLRHALTFWCAETTSEAEMPRCVSNTSTNAARDASGACVRLRDSQSCHAQGLCERQSNCKWDDAVADATERRELFTAASLVTAQNWMTRGYPSSLAPFLVPGIVLSVLLVLAFVAFVILRCVFNRCGGRNPSKKGYSRCDILIPATVYLVCSAAVFICALISIVQNAAISDGINGVIYSLNATLENVGIFTSNLETPLIDAYAQLADANAVVTALPQDLQWLTTNDANLQEMLTKFAAIYHAQGRFPYKDCDSRTSKACVACPSSVCGASLETFVANVTHALKNTSSAINASVHALKATFVDKNTELAVGLRTAQLEISKIANFTSRARRVVDVVNATVDDYSFSRTALVLSVFILGFVASAMGLFAIVKGVCKKKSAWVHLLHVSWIMAVLVCILGFVLSSSLLAVGAVWFDACSYMRVLHSDATPYFPATLAQTANSCFADDDAGVLSPLHLDDALSFQCVLADEASALTLADPMRINAAIAAYGARVATYSTTTFGLSDSVARDLMTKANAAVLAAGHAGIDGRVFSQITVVTPWTLYDDTSESYPCTTSDPPIEQLPICFMAGKCASSAATTASGKALEAKCIQAFTAAYEYTLSLAQVTAMLRSMRHDLQGMATTSAAFFSDAWGYEASIATAAARYASQLAEARSKTLAITSTGAVASVLQDVERVRCTESCGWINISFNSVHDAVCKDLLGTTLAISLCVFLLCMFLLPMIPMAVMLHKRLRGEKKGSYDELEMRIKALEAERKGTARAKAGKPHRESRHALFGGVKAHTDSA